MMRLARVALAIACAACSRAVVCGENPATEIERPVVEVIGITPIPGLGMPLRDVSSAVQSFNGEALRRREALDATKHAVLATIPAGNFSNGVTMRPDGARVFISNGRDASVSVIDTSTNAIIATVKVGVRPWNMAITPDGTKLYVANGRSNSVSVIDARSNAKLSDITVGELPWGVVIR